MSAKRQSGCTEFIQCGEDGAFKSSLIPAFHRMDTQRKEQ